MTRILSIILISVGTVFAQQSDVDSTQVRQIKIGKDKFQHAAYSCLWTLSSQYLVVNKGGLEEQKALPYAVSSGALIGIAKELHDSNSDKGHFSWGDILANGVGIALAIFIISASAG